MKKKYEKPVVNINALTTQDVILASIGEKLPGDCDIDLSVIEIDSSVFKGE